MKDCRRRTIRPLIYPGVELHKEGVKAEQAISRLPKDGDEVDVLRVPHDFLVERPGARPRLLSPSVRVDVVVHDVKPCFVCPGLYVSCVFVKCRRLIMYQNY